MFPEWTSPFDEVNHLLIFAAPSLNSQTAILTCGVQHFVQDFHTYIQAHLLAFASLLTHDYMLP